MDETAPVGVAFSFGRHRVVAATPADTERVQCFFVANPEYFERCEGRPPAASEGADFISDVPPAEFPCRAHHNLLLESDARAIDGVFSVACDLFAPGVWHLGLMMIATRLHGHGIAPAAYAAYEAWARAHGASWLRLCVVAQNARARRFWQRQGYAELCRYDGIEMGVLSNTVLVMWKSAGGRLDAYLEQVPRDRAA